MEIEIIKTVTFKDRDGNIRCVYNVGDRIMATHDAGHYFVTSMGGIYKDEAKIVT